MTRAELAKRIDHTMLKSTATERDLARLCQEAMEWNFYSVCVQPRWLPFVSEQLKGSQVLPITVVGFPLGMNQRAVKVFETHLAVESGAREIDMVVDLGAYHSGFKDEVEADIFEVVQAAQGRLVKVILETCSLNLLETAELSQISVRAGAHFVKTSTGFGSGGATVEHVAAMRKAVGPHFGVKSSGGIQSLAQALAMIHAGASRLGASASVRILQELPV